MGFTRQNLSSLSSQHRPLPPYMTFTCVPCMYYSNTEGSFQAGTIHRTALFVCVEVQCRCHCIAKLRESIIVDLVKKLYRGVIAADQFPGCQGALRIRFVRWEYQSDEVVPRARLQYVDYCHRDMRRPKGRQNWPDTQWRHGSHLRSSST